MAKYFGKTDMTPIINRFETHSRGHWEGSNPITPFQGFFEENSSKAIATQSPDKNDGGFFGRYEEVSKLFMAHGEPTTPLFLEYKANNSMM